jgi:hypothetical protein
MELATMLARVNDGRIACPSAFAAHLRRIVECAEVWYADSAGEETAMRQLGRVHMLLDEGLEELDTFNPALVARSEEIAKARAARGRPQAQSHGEPAAPPRGAAPARAKGSGAADAAARNRRGPNEATTSSENSAPAAACPPPADASERGGSKGRALRSSADTAGMQAEAPAAAAGAGAPPEDTAKAAPKDPAPPPKEAQVDRARLDALMRQLRSATDGMTVEELELLLVELYGAVSRHSRTVAKAALLNEMQALLDQTLQRLGRK